jgi:exopolyphosphatase/guanosine-5'-triphosphate,3'-diphosphate pyrophosphatase
MIQLMSLRIAAILCHARRDPDLKGFNLKTADDSQTGFVIQCKKSWVQQWPQSAHLLREECIAWQKTTWQLELVEINGKTV